MLEKVGIFILFLGPLVFFHELGHFFFARLFGVRVEVFSIGFGPKILKFKKGFTEYAVSLIPLGGYVKMFGDDPLKRDEINEADRQHSFTYKSKWARFWIVLGGPLANFIMAYVIFFFLFLMGETIPQMKVGRITEGSKLHQIGLRSGDVLQKVNGDEVYNPTDIVYDQVKSIELSRNKQKININTNIPGNSFFEEFVKNPFSLRKPFLVDKMGKKFILSFSPDKVDLDLSFSEMLHLYRGKTTGYIYPYNPEWQKTKETQIQANFVRQLNIVTSSEADLFRTLRLNDLYPVDLLVKSVNMNSPADNAKIQKDDIIVSLGGVSTYSFEDIRSKLQEVKNEKVQLGFIHQGKIKTVEIKPDVKQIGESYVRLIGVYSAGEFIKIKFVQTASKGFFKSLWVGGSRTWETIVKTLAGFKKLITAEVSIKSIGGPLAIGKVASDSFSIGLSYFFQLMAMISVNLGVINLFPIPVLDGGHIMFLFFEWVNRGPLSRRKMEMAQTLGLSLLLMLMVGAIFNDFTRFF